MRFAYADPPYPGCGHLYPENQEVDHEWLIKDVLAKYDGWALSTASTTLRQVLAFCPTDIRIMAWVKPFARWKLRIGVAHCWEPVIVRGGRRRSREQLTVRDYVSANMTLRRGVIGAKPDPFYHWLLQVLNVQPDDELDDLFPGTGGLERVRRQGSLILYQAGGEYRESAPNG